MKDSIKNPTNCQELIDDTLEIQCDECGTWHTPNEWGRFCSEECLEAYDRRLSEHSRPKINDMTIEELINNPLDALEPILEEHRKIDNLRNGNTGRL